MPPETKEQSVLGLFTKTLYQAGLDASREFELAMREAMAKAHGNK